MGNGLYDGQEENSFFLTTEWHGMQFTCGPEYRHGICHLSIIQPF